MVLVNRYEPSYPPITQATGARFSKQGGEVIKNYQKRYAACTEERAISGKPTSISPKLGSTVDSGKAFAVVGTGASIFVGAVSIALSIAATYFIGKQSKCRSKDKNKGQRKFC